MQLNIENSDKVDWQREKNNIIGFILQKINWRTEKIITSKIKSVNKIAKTERKQKYVEK